MIENKILSYQQQYANILNKLINEPHKKVGSRIGNVRSRFHETIRVDLEKEFPLMDIKWIKFSNILHEVLWFLRGETNIKYLLENGCNIWNKDAYRYFKEKYPKHKIQNLREFKENVLKGKKIHHLFKRNYKFGDMDRIYGFQWRKFNNSTDQIKNCIKLLKKDPDNRRILVTGHNPNDIEKGIVGLPSCHNLYQFYTVPMTYEERLKYVPKKLAKILSEEDLDFLEIPKRYINVWFNIRSNDWGLGQPYNMPSYSILLKIIGKLVNMVPKEVSCSVIDCHLYEKHLDGGLEWLNRYYKLIENNKDENEIPNLTYCKSKLKIMNGSYNSIEDFEFNDFELKNYDPQSYIYMELTS